MAKSKSICYMMCNDTYTILCADGKLRKFATHGDKKLGIKFSKQPWRFDKLAEKMNLKSWKTICARDGDRVFRNGDIHRKGSYYENNGIPMNKTNVGKLIEL